MEPLKNAPNSKCACGSGKKQKKCHPMGVSVCGPEPRPKYWSPQSEKSGVNLLPLLMGVALGSFRH